MEFKIFTYEEYEEIFNYLLSDIRDNTVVSKEDIKQEILIYLLRKEEKVFNNNSIENKRGYIVQLLKNHLKTLKGKFIYNNINHYDIDDYSEVLTEDIHYENSLINDIVIDDTTKYDDNKLNLLPGLNVVNKYNLKLESEIDETKTVGIPGMNLVLDKVSYDSEKGIVIY